MLKLFSAFFLIISIPFLSKTVDPEVTQLFRKASYEMIMTPDKSMDVIDFLQKNFPLNDEEKEKLEYLKIKSLFFQNRLTEALKKIAKDDDELPENILILKQSILYSLKIKADENDRISYNNKDYILSAKTMELLRLVEDNRIKNPAPQLAEILKIVRSSNLFIARENLLYLCYLFVNNDSNSSAGFFLEELMNLYKNDPDFAIVYANYLIKHNRTNDAVQIINSLPTEDLEQTTNVYLKHNFYELLVNYYSKINDFDRYNENLLKKDQTFQIIDKTQLSAKNKWFNIFEENLKNENISQSEKLSNVLWIIILGGSLFIVLVLLRSRQTNIQIKMYEDFISKIDLIKDKKPQQIQQGIPEKTENILLKKLEDFEKTDAFTDPGISLQSLAKKLETNTKYLSETINNHKQKNFNTYINELRVNYIIDKLKEKPMYRKYKIKYLAEESGFTTHSAFAAVFKSLTGLSPINYIQLLKEKDE